MDLQIQLYRQLNQAQEEQSGSGQRQLALLQDRLDRMAGQWARLRSDLACEAEVSKRDSARFLAPLAIGRACGVLLATFIILVLIPVLYLILEDFRRLYVPESAEQVKLTEVPEAS